MRLTVFLLLSFFLYPFCVFPKENIVEKTRDFIETIDKVKDSDIAQIAKGILQRSLILGLEIGQRSITFSGNEIENSDGTTEKAQGEFSSDYSYNPYIAFNFPGSKIYELSDDSYIGYLVLSEVTTYNLDRQSVMVPNEDGDGEEQKLLDLGTKATGTSISITPTIYYLSPYEDSNGSGELNLTGSIVFGFGLGFGYIDITGEGYITSDPESNCRYYANKGDVEGIKTNCEKKSFSQSGETLSMSIFVGYFFEDYFITYSSSGPFMGDVSAKKSTFTFAYAFEF